jgi:hypothetical protein
MVHGADNVDDVNCLAIRQPEAAALVGSGHADSHEDDLEGWHGV